MIAVMTRFAMPAFLIWQVRSASFFGGMLTPAPSLYGSRMMAATQRVVEYAKLQPEEGSFAPPGCDVLDTWPARGDVVLRDVRLRYAPELPQALFYSIYFRSFRYRHSLDFEVVPGAPRCLSHHSPQRAARAVRAHRRGQVVDPPRHLQHGG